MKLLVVLALVGLVYGEAKPQWLLPGVVTTKTAQVGETPESTYTATYGHAALPLTYSYPLTYSHPLTYSNPLTYSHGLLPYTYPFGYPLWANAKPAEEEAPVEAARKKREAVPEAEPEAEADPQLLLSTGLHYPAAVTTYASPATYTYPTTYTIPRAYSAFPATYSYTHGLYPYSGLYGSPFGYPLLAAAAKPAEEEAPVEAARKKRSAQPEAEPEADPQLLYSGLHYTGLPTTYSYPLGYHAPLTYTAAAATPLNYHAPLTYTYPLGTSYLHGGYPLLSTLAVAKE